MSSEKEFDVIIIGSGMGALTVASLLAQFTDRRIAMIEQHFKFGGFTHIFKRKQKYHWDVGIHYIGEMHEDSMLRKIFDLVTRSEVKWHKMPHIFDKFVYPDFTFGVPADEEEYRQKLIEQFPAEEEGIINYFKDIKKLSGWFGRHVTMKALPAFLDVLTSKLDLLGSSDALITTKDYLDRNFKDEKLKALLVSQWGDYGLPPGLSAFAIHALIVHHYLRGGYYPVGTSKTIADSVLRILEEKGALTLLSHKVESILVENNTTRGVRVRDIKKDETFELYADTVISNAGAYNTYVNLVPESVNITFRQQLKDYLETAPHPSNVTLYAGLKESPEKLGFRGENHWIYSSYDHDQNFEKRHEWVESDEPPAGAYLSFPSLKNPQADGHTAEIIAFTGYEPFERWKDEPWKKRGEEYSRLKERITEKLLNYIEERYPGFRELVDYTELSTPLSNEFFSAHPKGTIYGLSSVPDRFRKEKAPWFNAKTPVEGLYLTGADAASMGIGGAMMGGITTIARIVNGLSLMQILRKAGR